MSAIRTQIYLTVEQRTRLDAIGMRDGKGLATLIREAVDGYLASMPAPEPEAALRATFGALPSLEVPARVEWDRG